MKKAVIYDYETLGKNPQTLPILSLATCEFKLNELEEFDDVLSRVKFYKFSVEDQIKNYNRKIDQETVDWWMTQDKETRDSQLKPTKNDLQLSELYDIMSKTCDDNTIVFTRGNTFDPIITDVMCKLLNKPYPYPWWNDRDTRSFIEGLSYGSGLKNNFLPPQLEGVEMKLHDPRVDIALDIIRIQSLIQAVTNS